MKFSDLPNYRKAELHRVSYKKWKESSLENIGYFPVFQTFKDSYILKEISGNALKLYIYLGLHTGNKSGETWITIDSMSRYFGKSPRTISNWLEELLRFDLIERYQFKPDTPSHTFLKPYGNNSLLKGTEGDYENGN